MSAAASGGRIHAPRVQWDALGEVAVCLKLARRRVRMTQRAVADAIGVSLQTVTRRECGGQDFLVRELPAYAKAYGITVDVLLEGCPKFLIGLCSRKNISRLSLTVGGAGELCDVLSGS